MTPDGFFTQVLEAYRSADDDPPQVCEWLLALRAATLLEIVTFYERIERAPSVSPQQVTGRRPFDSRQACDDCGSSYDQTARGWAWHARLNHCRNVCGRCVDAEWARARQSARTSVVSESCALGAEDRLPCVTMESLFNGDYQRRRGVAYVVRG